MGSLIKIFSFVISIVLLLSPVSGSLNVIQAQSPSPVKILIDAQDEAAFNLAVEQGGTLLVDYGSFSLWQVPQTQQTIQMLHDSIEEMQNFDRIWLRGDQYIDGLEATEPVVKEVFRQRSIEGNQFWMVQFIGPIKDEWLQSLQGMGFQLVVYMPNNAYVIWGNSASINQLTEAVQAGMPFQWAGAYHPQYRLSPSLSSILDQKSTSFQEVTVQLFRTETTEQSIQNLMDLAEIVYLEPEEILNFVNIHLQIPVDRIAEIAAWTDVFNVEPWQPPQKMDEVQNMIMAGQVMSSGGNIVPTGPGYLNWLASKGFPTTPGSYPVVDIVDDGLDQGLANQVLHPDFHEFGSSNNPDRVLAINNCTLDALGDGHDGHGNLNAGIVAAYNNKSGSPHVDSKGYRLDLGVDPYGRISSTKIFNNSGYFNVSACGNSYSGIVAASVNGGANLTSNSWGAPSEGAYDSSCQAYDSLTRDTSSSISGNQEMLHIFSAGNEGRNGSYTIGSPGSAKNVLTVGATENVRAEGVMDGCGTTQANSADDLADFSSRGPTADGRVKPDIVAPGTHVQGPASQAAGYSGYGVCGYGTSSPFNYPVGQSLYTWSSGTSHSAPAVSGAAALAYEYYGRVINPGAKPSPAMLKALLLNSTRYLNGVATGGNLPTNQQGWGDVNLGTLFDSTPRMVLDQRSDDLFSQSGDTRTYLGQIANSSQPLRVTLVWTDAPGSTTGASYVNNLDLEVVIGGITYKGNVFSGANSLAGGSADSRNNVESVFLPAGRSGEFEVRVIARNIVGDGLPGNADMTDQDFALVVSNFNKPSGTQLSAAGFNLIQVSGNSDNIVGPGEVFNVQIPLKNLRGTTAVISSATLSLLNSGASMLQSNATYPQVPYATTKNNQTYFRVWVNPDKTCSGDALQFQLTVNYNNAQPYTYNFSIPVGPLPSETITKTYSSGSIALVIPDGDSAGVNSIISVPEMGIVGDVNVYISTISHSKTSQIKIKLTSPTGKQVSLFNYRSSMYGIGDITFDDSATRWLSNNVTTFSGTYHPETPLYVNNGDSKTGDWTLNVSDCCSGDTGRLFYWNVIITPQPYVCTAFVNHTPTINAIPIQSGFQGIPFTLQVAGRDVDQGQTLSYALEPGAPSGVTIDSKTGVLRWNLPHNQPLGEYSITVHVSDDHAVPLSTSASFTITVMESIDVYLPLLTR